ncbi:hypothetical protein F5878DRAFT_498569, partial [Lentinula raphanica]
FLINTILLESGYSLRNFGAMPLPQHDWSKESENPLIAEQLDYNCDTEHQYALNRIPQLNPEQ